MHVNDPYPAKAVLKLSQFATQAVPQVSIGMPVFNGELFIRDALDSLLSQTFTDFELIISDNASTDNTGAICREYAKNDLRIKYVRQTENRGLIPNFQFVLDAAVGEYFMWAAADDVWDRLWLETLLPVAKRFKCLAFGEVVVVNEAGETITHPANYRNLSFKGKRVIRRLQYYIDPPFKGKANPVYGVVHRAFLDHEVFSVLKVKHKGSDMLFLFNILDKIEIRSVSSHLKKRYHQNNEGEEMVSGIRPKKPIAFRLLAVIINILVAQVDRFKGCSELSTKLEGSLLLVLSPIAISLDLITTAKWYLRRSWHK